MIEHYKSQIDAALRYGGDTHSFAEIATMVAENDAQMWTAPQSILITAVVAYPSHKLLFLWLGGGNIIEIEQLVERALAWGREQECSRASFIGRRGWERTFLSRTGWRNTGNIVMEKSL